MPRFRYDGHMPSQEVTTKTHGKPSILRECLEALAVHFGWDDWSHYHRNNYNHAKELKQQVYDMSHSEKIQLLAKLRNNE